MKTDIVTSVSITEQENFKNTRKALQVLQPAAADKENLVDPGRKFNASHSKGNLIEEIYLPTRKVFKKKKKLAHKSTTDTDISKEDLTNDEASLRYYKLLAERLRVQKDQALAEKEQALEEKEQALAEKEQALAEKKQLEEEKNIYKNLFQQAKDLTDVLTEIIDEKEEKEKAEKSVHLEDSLLH